MKKRRLPSVLLCIIAALPGATRAQTWSAAASVGSDYRLRGISLNGRRPAAALDLSASSDAGWSLGLGLAALGGGEGLANVDLSRSWQLGDDWSASAGLGHRAYAGSARARAYDHDELRASVQWRGLWSASVTVMPRLLAGDGYGHDYGRRATVSAESALRWPLGHGVALDGGAGVLAVDGAGHYRYGSLGLAWARGPLQATLARVDSNAHSQRLASLDAARAGWLAGLSWSF